MKLWRAHDSAQYPIDGVSQSWMGIAILRRKFFALSWRRRAVQYNANFNPGQRHHRSRKAEQPWCSWYRSPIWKTIRRHRLAEEPFCRECASQGQRVPASHVAHVEPHRGEWALFMKYENTRSLCHKHHNEHRHKANCGNGGLYGPVRKQERIAG